MDKPNSNAVDTKKESRTSSHAQEPSRLKTAKDITATGTSLPASSQSRDNSQMSKHATLPAKSQIAGRNATLLPRSAKTAPREAKAATPMLSAKLLATLPWPNAMTQPEYAQLAKKIRTLTALKVRELAMLAARSLTIPNLSATKLMANA